MSGMFNRVMKNFFSKPATRLYPANDRKPFERTRGRIYFDGTNCLYCSLCQRKCPADAIEVDRANSTWKLNAFRCIICGECANSCPKKCISLSNKRRNASNVKEQVAVKKVQ